SFSEYKHDLYDRELRNLVELSLNEDRRVCFYAAGFAEGLLLEKRMKKWKEKYLVDKFYLENY
ncbi:MAG: hypothetical protein OEQ53_20750, partial [Saprospiraceae bacterium]|nr:hypothetical protein [Saprospiraceae bacterium]